jgi:hypothetical protein
MFHYIYLAPHDTIASTYHIYAARFRVAKFNMIFIGIFPNQKALRHPLLRQRYL